MNTPKYQLGEAVYVEFTGDVEGVAVKVRKELWIISVSHGLTDSGIFNEGVYYRLSENPPVHSGKPGRVYHKWEKDIAGLVEPVIAEVAKARAEKQTADEQQAARVIEAITTHVSVDENQLTGRLQKWAEQQQTKERTDQL